MNTKNWHVPIRSEVDLRSIKTKVLRQWFGNPVIGTFPAIVKNFAEEFKIDPKGAAADVERILKRNSSQSILKPRHLEIAKALYKNGYAAGAIAKLLGEIESFKVGIDVVRGNLDLIAWKKETPLPNPQDTDNRKKTAESGETDIELFKDDGKGGKAQYARLPIQKGGVEWTDSKPGEMPVTQRDSLIGNLYRAYLNPTQIAQVMTKLTGTEYSGIKVSNILQKRIPDQVEGWQSHEFGLFKRAEFRSMRWQVAGDKVIIYEETLSPSEHDEDAWVATVARDSGDITWYRDPLKARVDRAVLDKTIANLYAGGVAPKQIPAIIEKVYEFAVTTKQVRRSIEKATKQGDFHHYKKGHFHAEENRYIDVKAEGDEILIKKRIANNPETIKAKISKKTGEITWVMGEGQDIMLDQGGKDACIARLYKNGVNSAKIVDTLHEVSRQKVTISHVAHRLRVLEKQGIIIRYKLGESNTARRRAIQVRVQDTYIKVYREKGSEDVEIIDQFDITNLAPITDNQTQNLREGSPAVRWEDKLLETYVRIRWHSDPGLEIAGEIGKEVNISVDSVRKIVTQQNSWGILKPTHVQLIRDLYNARVSTAEIGRTLGEIEGISLSTTPISTKIRWLEEGGLVTPQPPKRYYYTKRVNDQIMVFDNRTGDCVTHISLKSAEGAIEQGLGESYGQKPPTINQIQKVQASARTTHDTLEQIIQETGHTKTSVQAILLYGVYQGYAGAYEARFCTNPDQAFLDKLTSLAKRTEGTLVEIAEQCGCSVHLAAKWILKEAYGGNKLLYQKRFNPPPLTPEQVALANKLAQAERAKGPAERGSFSSIVRKVGGTFDAVRSAVVGGTYNNEENAFTNDYPAGRHDLTLEQTRDVIREVTTTRDSVYKIANRLGLGEAAVSRVALMEVYAHDYERYAARFPEKRVDEAAVAAATKHIRDPRSPYRTYKSIAQAISAEVAPVSPASVMILARQLLTKAEREERFAGDPDYRIGQVTHVVVEGVCKQAAARLDVAGYSETRLHRHHRKHDGPAPTEQQLRWVKADLILRLKDGQAGELLGRAGADGVPLGDEAGWSPEIVAATREILFEFGADQTPASVQRKDAKYAADRHGHPRKGRLVFHVATADWWGEGRVQADPGNLPNVRVTNLGFVADLLQMSQHERETLAEMTRNNRARDQAAQERLAEKEKLSYCDDTARYYADKGIPIPDWHGPQQTLDATIEAAQQAANGKGKGKGSDPARLAEAQKYAKAIREAQDADAARVKEKEKRGIDTARLAEAREYANVLQAARDTDAARVKEKEKRGIDAARLAEAREYAKALREVRDAEKARADTGPDPVEGAGRE